MIRKFSLGLILGFSSLVSLTFAATSVNDQVIPVTSAIIRDICREVFWQGKQYPFGESFPLHIKIDGDNFYAWVEHLGPFQNDLFSYYYKGRIRIGDGVVVSKTGLNERLKLPPPTPWSSAQPKKSKEGISTLTLPPSCPPWRESSTSTKDRMVQTVFSTILYNVKVNESLGIVSYPRNLRIIVADFNVDYPFTYVLIEDDKFLKLIVVYLHNADDWDNEEYQRGPYPIVERRIGAEHKELLRKIRNYGLVRQVSLKQ